MSADTQTKTHIHMQTHAHTCTCKHIHRDVFWLVDSQSTCSLTDVFCVCLLLIVLLLLSVSRHVFLGFSRDGQFVLSYTMQVEVDSTVPAGGNSYRLQCWLFTPYRPLRLVQHCSRHIDSVAIASNNSGTGSYLLLGL